MVFFRWIWVGFRQEVSGNAKILETNCSCRRKISKGHQELWSKRRVNGSQRGHPARAAIGTSTRPFTHTLSDKTLQTLLSSFARLIYLRPPFSSPVPEGRSVLLGFARCKGRTAMDVICKMTSCFPAQKAREQLCSPRDTN